MRIKITLDEDMTKMLVKAAVAERRPLVFEAEVLLKQVLEQFQAASEQASKEV